MSTLQAERWGESGPRVVLVHGSLSSAAAAFGEQQALANRWSLIAPYRRGYSPSPPTDQVDYDRDAEDVLEIVGSGAHVVGTSMGGIVVMRAAAQSPQVIRSLTVIEPPALPNAAGRPEADRLSAALREHWQTHDPNDLEGFVSGFLAVLGVSMELPSPLPPTFAEAVRNLTTERPWETTGVPLDVLAQTTFPKLVVSGGGTPGFEDACDVLAEQLDAKRLKYPGSPHGVQSIGEPFNAEFEKFITAAETPK